MALHLRGPLQDNPTAKILQSLLLGTFCWMFIHVAVNIPFFAVRKRTSLILGAFLILFLAAALVLLRQGLWQTAGLLCLCGYGAAATLLIIFSGGIHSPGLVLYIGLPVCAAWLLGNRVSMIATGVCLIVTLALAILEQQRVGPVHYYSEQPLSLWTVFLLALMIAGAPVTRILRVLQEALAQAKAKSIFLAGMSSDLRTPLNAILGFSRLMHDDADTSAQQRRYLAIINRSGEQLLNAVDNVLDLAEIEAGRIAVENTAFDLEHLLRDLIDGMRERARAKDLQLILDLPPAVPRFVRSDAAKLRQIVVCLVSNAIQFTGAGDVTLRLDIQATPDSPRLLLRLEVAATASSVTAQDPAQVFEPFVQPHVTGVGLSITRQFVEILHGKISIERTPGEGTLFRVQIPVERAEAPSALSRDRKGAVHGSAERPGAVLVASPSAPLRSRVSADAADELPRDQTSGEFVIGLAAGQPEYRILVVDEADNGLLLEQLLQQAGFQVQVAENGSQAIERFQRWKPHLIWMDLHPPAIGGLDLARRIRALAGGREVKIIALTASASTSQRGEVLAAGMDDFLRKPYRRSQVFDCIARHLGTRFIYGKSDGGLETAKELRPEALAVLPENLRNELRTAVISLDVGRITEVIHRIAGFDAALGTVLLHYSETFAYTAILRAVAACKGSFTEEIV